MIRAGLIGKGQFDKGWKRGLEGLKEERAGEASSRSKPDVRVERTARRLQWPEVSEQGRNSGRRRVP